MTLTAKPVIDKQFWILKQDDQKIGNIQVAADGSYEVKILNDVSKYKTIPLLRRKVGIEFEPAEKKSKTPTDSVHGYVTGCRAYNGMWDVKKRLPLFTKTARSKSWYAAGWFAVLQHNRWQLVQNPKLILLERYQFRGPYMREDQVRMDP